MCGPHQFNELKHSRPGELLQLLQHQLVLRSRIIAPTLIATVVCENAAHAASLSDCDNQTIAMCRLNVHHERIGDDGLFLLFRCGSIGNRVEPTKEWFHYSFLSTNRRRQYLRSPTDHPLDHIRCKL
jgi:hypothetical protein